jgi:formate hydrogenlyase subunit 6/NADH:ubiquinone oxidoreductase subunit I
VQRADQLDLGFRYCVYGPRSVLFPSSETLFEFDGGRDGFTTKPVQDCVPTAIVGVHPCDVNAIKLLDRVFEKDYRDERYLARREATFIVAVDCPEPCTEGVFCLDMHANEAERGFDVLAYPLSGDDGRRRYGIVFGTDAGRAWLRDAPGCEVPSAEDEHALEQYQRAKAAAFARSLKTDGDDLPALLDRSYDSLLWEATARRCYSCGSCNLACPTCYCFNIYDEFDLSLKSGRRRREWDGCQLKPFAAVAGGHNFREKAGSRLRHRIYRKAKWVYEQSGERGCVGCGRCDRTCPAKISSVEIYNQLAEEV